THCNTTHINPLYFGDNQELAAESRRIPERVEAEKILDQLKELSKQRYVAAYSFALVYLGLGDKKEALGWLEKSYQDRSGAELGYIRIDPLLDPLRGGDPRFEALAEKIVPAREFGTKTTSK